MNGGIPLFPPYALIAWTGTHLLFLVIKPIFVLYVLLLGTDWSQFTNSTQQGSFWKLRVPPGDQEIPPILRKPHVHCRVNNSPPHPHTLPNEWSPHRLIPLLLRSTFRAIGLPSTAQPRYNNIGLHDPSSTALAHSVVPLTITHNTILFRYNNTRL
jgi:hypothetical protein